MAVVGPFLRGSCQIHQFCGVSNAWLRPKVVPHDSVRYDRIRVLRGRICRPRPPNGEASLGVAAIVARARWSPHSGAEALRRRNDNRARALRRYTGPVTTARAQWCTSPPTAGFGLRRVVGGRPACWWGRDPLPPQPKSVPHPPPTFLSWHLLVANILAILEARPCSSLVRAASLGDFSVHSHW